MAVSTVKLLDPKAVDRRLDRYELIGEIASGGMATVFLARISGVGGFQRFVAVKRLHPHLSGDPEFVAMFLDEARLAAGIHHPHVVPIIEVGVSQAGYYLVMEYIEGATLAQLMTRAGSTGARLPRPIVVRIALDILAGLHAAHELNDAEGHLVGLVHRDVSPQNLLVGVDGSARITDFGVARASARLSTTRAGKLKGKLAYMSPEQTEGVVLDRRADVFAMGIILWEILTGKRLFKADSEAATLARILNRPIPLVSSIAPDIPHAFDEVCAKALERAPLARFQTAAEMADALERAARRAAAASTYDSAIAAPKDVSVYVQALIGQEVNAQRESVRAWIAQAEAANAAQQQTTSQITIRVALDAAQGPSSDSVPTLENIVGDETLGDTLVADKSKASLAMPNTVPAVTPRAYPPPPPARPTHRGLSDPPPAFQAAEEPIPPSKIIPIGDIADPPSYSETSQNVERIALDPTDMWETQRMAARGREPDSDATTGHSPRVIPRTLASSSYTELGEVGVGVYGTPSTLPPAESTSKKRYVILSAIGGALLGGYLMWTVLWPLAVTKPEMPAPPPTEPAATAAAPLPPEPTAALPVDPPAEIPSAEPAAKLPTEPTADSAEAPSDAASKSEPAATSGKKGSKKKPATSTTGTATAKPTGGDDLSNPYR